MPERLVAHARGGWGCVQGQREAGATAVKLLGSAETAVPAGRLGRRCLKPSPPPSERLPIVLLGGEGVELLRLGPRGSPGRLTVRAQLSWRSWGKFCDLGRGRGPGARAPPPAAAPRGRGPDRSREGGGAAGRAGGGRG